MNLSKFESVTVISNIYKATCCFTFLQRGNSKYADYTLCSMTFLLWEYKMGIRVTSLWM